MKDVLFLILSLALIYFFLEIGIHSYEKISYFLFIPFAILNNGALSVAWSILKSYRLYIFYTTFLLIGFIMVIIGGTLYSMEYSEGIASIIGLVSILLGFVTYFGTTVVWSGKFK